MNPVLYIPARGGSKGLPGKNLREVAGIPLVGRAIRVALEFRRLAALPDTPVIVDTDDPAIADAARRWGGRVPFLRAPQLARDDTSTVETVLGAIQRLAVAGERYDAIILLQPTSPLRTAVDVLGCWQQWQQAGCDTVVAITPLAHPIEHAVELDRGGRAVFAAGPFPARRQDAPPRYRVAGSVYVIRTEALERERRFFIPGSSIGVPVNPPADLDVDTEVDLRYADALARSAPAAGFSLDGRQIGGGGACFVIAEAGVNHNGDVGLAHRLVDVAVEAGADAVKFQTFTPEALASPSAPKAAYQAARSESGPDQLGMLRQLALPVEAWAALRDHCADRGILFLSSPFDTVSADLLADLGVPAFKVPSGELTNHPLIHHLAAKGRPLLISTGMATLDEVSGALEAVRAASDSAVALFHCVTSYPAHASDCNLRAMATLRSAFGVPTGWSDHSEGIDIALAAVAQGAELVEKHFTTDSTLPGPDHRASLEPGQLAELILGIRRVEAAGGDGRKVPAAAEVPLAAVARRSLHAARDLPAGTVLTRADLTSLRPGTGLPPSRLPELVGRHLRQPLAALTLVTEDVLD